MKKRKLLIRWLCGCLIFFGCSRKSNEQQPESTTTLSTEDIAKARRIHAALAECKKLIRGGDVVTRTGNDFTSQSLRTLNRRDKTFSHCGIASMEHDSLFIYHALGGEYNPDQHLKRESFEAFSDPNDNVATGIFRFDMPAKNKERLMAVARELYVQKMRFDMDFDLKTDDKMYCAEFVYKSFLKATDSTIRFPHSIIRDFEFVGVDDIILDPRSTKIAVLNYRLY